MLCAGARRKPEPGAHFRRDDLTIEADGKPRTVDLKYRHRMADRAKECLRDAALALTFPASLAGAQTGPIAFAPPAP